MEQDVWKQVLHKLDKIEAGQLELQNDVAQLKVGQQRLESDVTNIKADIATIQKDTALLPFIQQAVSEVKLKRML